MAATPVAVDGQAAVVRVNVSYGDPVQQEYRDLGCCSLPTTVGSATSRNGPTGRASHIQPARRRSQMRRSVSGSGPAKYWSMTCLKIA